MEWLPIETAPKDGTVILLCNRAGVFIGIHRAVYTSVYRPKDPWHSLLLNRQHMSEDGRYEPPTQWMPLPAPHLRISR